MHIRIRRYCSSTDFHIDISKTASRFSIPVRIVRALMPHSISRTPEHCSRCWHTLGWPEMSDRWRTRTLARSVAGVRVKSMRSQPIWPLCAMSKYSLPLPLPSIVIINCVMCIFLVAPIRNRTCWWCIRSACCACPAVHRMTIFVRYQRCVATMRTASNVAILRRSAKRPTKREQEAERERERESAKSRRRNESNHERDRERERGWRQLLLVMIAEDWLIDDWWAAPLPQNYVKFNMWLGIRRNFLKFELMSRIIHI